MRLRIFGVVLSGIFFLCSSACCFAASDPTDAFVSNAWPNVNFLDQSSRLAMTKSTSGRIRNFARSEAAEQTAAANAFVAWADANATGGPPANAPSAAAGSIVALPLRAAARVTSNIADGLDGVAEGRSVAIDAPPQRPEHRVILKSSSANLSALSSLRGAAFDRFYTKAQRDALLQLTTIYAAYIQTGEDAGLRALAVRELPKINERLASLRKL